MSKIKIFFSLLLCLILISEYILIANTIAPILFEEQVVAKRKVIIGIRDKTILFYSYEDIPESEIQNENNRANDFKKVIVRSEKKFLFFSLIKKPLPPKLTLKIGKLEIPILGWAFTGPGPHIIFELYEKLRDFFGKFDIHLLGLRILGLIFLFAFSFPFAKHAGSILALPFFIAFPTNLIFMHIESLYYLIMTAATFLCYFALQKKKFHTFHLLSIIQCLTHFRGYVISLAFILAFIIARLIEKEGSKKENIKEVKQFISSIILFSPLYLLPIFIYSLPHFVKIENEYERYILALPSLSQIIKNQILAFISKIPFLHMLLFSKIRDLLICGNFQIFFMNYGVVIKGAIYYIIFRIDEYFLLLTNVLD